MEIISITKNHKDYPERLKPLAKPPAKINVAGNLNKLLSLPTIGIVGSRKVTSYGRGVTEELAEGLARMGVCIVSGLALGVDSIAHGAALKANGSTIAVLPSGIKTVYPASHRELARNIVKKDGVLVSEYENDFRPRIESFIQRNRIIAGLSDALLVTEAAEKSGSLHTANFALETGRTVLAVPGNITNTSSAGTNNLLKSGAILVTCLEDILEALHIKPKKPEQMDIYGDNEHETTLLDLLRGGIHEGDELLSQSNMDIRKFQQTLSMLEIKGHIGPLGNNRWRLK